MRTQEEIVARIHELSGQNDPTDRVLIHDLFGFERSVLLGYLDFEHAEPFREEFKGKGVTAAQWEAEYPVDKRTEEYALIDARDYADFAWDKVGRHRTNSAMRNLSKMGAWAWLLGKDDAIAKAADAPYEPYGAPRLRILCEGLGFPMPNDHDLHRMADGQPCRPDCEWGCR